MAALVLAVGLAACGNDELPPAGTGGSGGAQASGTGPGGAGTGASSGLGGTAAGTGATSTGGASTGGTSSGGTSGGGTSTGGTLGGGGAGGDAANGGMSGVGMGGVSGSAGQGGSMAGGSGRGGTGGAAGAQGGSAGSAGRGGSGGGGSCQKGTTKGNEVAMIGESFIAQTHDITEEIERLARAAGSLAQNERYVDNSVSGTTLAGGGNSIPNQYARAAEGAGTIRYVLMDGGGNDCLLNNNGDAAFTAAQMLFQTMAQNGTEKVVYFFYPDPIGATYANLKTCLDALRPRMKTLCDGLTSPKCYWLDLRPVWNGHPEYTRDGIHPEPAGSVATGAAIWQVMQANCVAQ